MRLEGKENVAPLISDAGLCLPGPGGARTPTFADEALLGDGLLADVAALSLLERLQLEGVCVHALQLVRLREEK